MDNSLKIENYNGYQLHINKLVLNASGVSQTVLIFENEKCVGASYANTAFENAIEKAKTKIDSWKKKKCIGFGNGKKSVTKQDA